ncbi:MAG TPA: hypothetical protein VJ952_02375, partial [Opitutales bacterium]|nr:hypothetical protein [Opitutales bacterium]
MNKTLITFSAAALLTGMSAHGALLYEESFNYDTGDLSTVTSDVWSDTGSVVGSGSLAFGSLATAGNKVEGMTDDTSWTSTGTALDGALDNGDTLWFSVLFYAERIGTNPDFGFALGTDKGNDSNNIPLSTADGGNGLGFRVKGNRGGLTAAYWSGG